MCQFYTFFVENCNYMLTNGVFFCLFFLEKMFSDVTMEHSSDWQFTLSVHVLGDWTMQVSVRRLGLYSLGGTWSGQIRGAVLNPIPHILSPGTRTLFSETGVWEKDYRTETRRRAEEWWHPRIMAQWRKDALEEVRRPFTFYAVSYNIYWQSVFLEYQYSSINFQSARECFYNIQTGHCTPFNPKSPPSPPTHPKCLVLS